MRGHHGGHRCLRQIQPDKSRGSRERVASTFPAVPAMPKTPRGCSSVSTGPGRGGRQSPSMSRIAPRTSRNCAEHEASPPRAPPPSSRESTVQVEPSHVRDGADRVWFSRTARWPWRPVRSQTRG